MTVMEPGAEILKVDEVGRVRTPPEKQEAGGHREGEDKKYTYH